MLQRPALLAALPYATSVSTAAAARWSSSARLPPKPVGDDVLADLDRCSASTATKGPSSTPMPAPYRQEGDCRIDGRLLGVRLAGETLAQAWLKQAMAEDELDASLIRFALAPSAKPPVTWRRATSSANVPMSATCRSTRNWRPAPTCRSLQEKLKCGTFCGACVPDIKRMVPSRQPTTERRPETGLEETMSYAHYIKEIGRGAQGARDLSRDDARQLYAAMLDGGVPDLELGAIILGLRVKGESLDEMLGFMAAMDDRTNRLDMPHGRVRPVVLPTYNGARKEANLTPLLALLLQRFGVPVLVHGLLEGYGRVTSAQVFRELGIMPVASTHQAQAAGRERPGFPAAQRPVPRHAQPALRCAAGWACATAPTAWSS
jgi:hypothetical protein